MDLEKRNTIIKNYNFKLVNIVNNINFRKFGNHDSCKCMVEMSMDNSIKEEVVIASICDYCEWAQCCECELYGLVNIKCKNESHNTK